MTIGGVVHDRKGNAWVYVGYRVTSTGSHSHTFVKALTETASRAAPVWTYEASNHDTIRKQFPDLAEPLSDGQQAQPMTA